MKHTPQPQMRKELVKRGIALTLALVLLENIVAPTAVFALTSGPGQPEFASFEPVGTSDMVDIYSGDFTYNLPLLSVPGPNGGYPINLAYHANPGVDEEASWVGLGWNVNVGAINRQLRGLPDDFKGDQVIQRSSLKPSITTTLNLASAKKELFGVDQDPAPTLNKFYNPAWQIYYNNYRGLGYRVTTGVYPQKFLGTVHVGLSFDSQNGVGAEANLTLDGQHKRDGRKVVLGIGYNNRQGMQEASFAVAGSSTRNIKEGDGAAMFPWSSTFSFSTNFNIPSVSTPMRSNTYQFGLHLDPANGVPAPYMFQTQFPQSEWTGSYAESQVAQNGVVQSPAYGYLYTGSASTDGQLRDFQREYIPYSKNVPNLAPATYTYDQFSQTGQGTGSMFRPQSNSVGPLYDRKVVNDDYSYPMSVEYGSTGATLQHFGVGATLGAGTNSSGAWESVGANSDVKFSNVLNFNLGTDPQFEASPFMVLGEKAGVLDSEDHLKAWGGDEAVKVKLGKDQDANWLDRQFTAQNLFVKDETDVNGFVAGAAQKKKNNNRQRRTTNYEQLTDAEAAVYGFTRFEGCTLVAGNYINKAKTFYGGAKANHISEITTVQPDGMRYTYGVPLYNNVQYDGSFAINQPNGNFNTKTVPIPYTAGSWQPNVSGTTDEFSQQTELGAYVHSWLLSSVVSDDYIDHTNNGPSDDDYGYWVRFNYKETTTNYAWHVPYQGANYLEGKKGDPSDDRASYSCGNREEYYLEAIETKTHIAIFYTSKREDGVMAAANLNGGLPSTINPTDRLYKLDSVALYTKAEYFDNLTTRHVRTNPVAIKKVHFRYSYELCGKPAVGHPDYAYYNQFATNNTGFAVDENGNPVVAANPANINANKGKLTLKKVYFTYQNSERGEFSPYLFTYGSGASGSDDNPFYDPTAVDRWGNYKKITNYLASGNAYPYVDMAYTDQTSTQTNHEQKPGAGAWCLKNLTLPSGARIQVSYEPDDYGYVENKKAMHMFDIVGLGETTPSLPTNADKRQAAVVQTANTESASELLHQAYRVYFRLEEVQQASAYPLSVDQNNYIKEKYLNQGQLKQLYFKTYMDLKKNGVAQEKEYVSGYADLFDTPGDVVFTNNSVPTYASGMASSTGSNTTFDLGYITLKGVKPNSAAGVGLPAIPKISPFTRAAFEVLHFSRSELVHAAVPYANPNTPPAQIANLLGSVAAAQQDIYQAMIGFNVWAYMKGYSKKMDLNGRSVIRLVDPNLKKYGGGCRVSRITVNDNWDNDNTANNVADPDNFEYGLTYDYTIKEAGQTISSGVCYEPRIAGEESALREPVNYVHSVPLHADEHLFVEKPVLESYYPGASVGYRKVTVTSIAPEKADMDDNNLADGSNVLKNNAAPISIYQFYTPKEFPVFADETDINADPAIIRPLFIPGIFTSFKKRKARSQGYSIVLNDMAGKMRTMTQRTRPTAANPQGTLITKQEYTYNTEKPFSDYLDNKLSSKVQVLTSDGSFQTAVVGQSHDIFIDMNENRQQETSAGLDVNLDMSGSVLIPSAFPTISKTDLSLRTVVTNKIIFRTGIVKAVEATHEASTIKTENIAFDLQTGDPLLTKTYNEFKDPIYSYSYPGHWYYKALRGAYLNYGVVVDQQVTDVNGNVQTLSPLLVQANGRVDNLTAYLSSSLTQASDYFTAGDELWVDFASGGTDGRYHVAKVGSTYIDLINKSGNFAPNGATITSVRVIRSGYDNRQTLAVGSLTTRTASIPQYDPQVPATQFNAPFAYTLTDILNASAVELTDIMQVDCTPQCAFDNVNISNVVNPWAAGLRGIWRPFRSYAFVADRNQADNIRSDGTYTSFIPFPWTAPSTANAAWTSASSITKYSPYGFELENKNATGNYSAALYEYNKTVNTAVASNAKYKEIASDGFEDYAQMTNCDLLSDHWGFASFSIQVVSTQAHTGKRSIKLTNGQTISISNFVRIDTCETNNANARLINVPVGANNQEYVLDECDCVGKFQPDPGKKYVLSAWVKQTPVGGSAVNTLANYVSPKVVIELVDGAANITTVTSSASTDPVIEGWQRIYFFFTIPSNTVSMNVKLVNDAGNASDDYFDDIRMHPYDANMMTYVYDPMTYRVVAQLDANNFATFYIYDEQGMLEKTKVETLDGIKTVQEGRSNTDKH